MSEEKVIKSYKGFAKDLKCRDYQYEVGKEYELPEGEKAKARAGKSLDEIFPEMKESEDERIRKELIDFVNHYRHNTDLTTEQAEWCKMAIAYLEKQKEQTEELSTRLNGLMQEYVKEGKDEEDQEHRLKCYQLFWDALGDSEFFEQKEQKPVAGENPQTSAEILRHYLVWAGNSEEDCPYTWKTLADAIRDGIKALEEQKPAVTSNIDLDTKVNVWVGYMLNDNAQSYSRKDVQIMLDNCARYFYDYAVMCLDKPAEWSEEDEKIAKEIEEELWYPGNFPDYPSKEESELYDDCQRKLDWFKTKFKSLKNRGNFPKSNTNSPSEWSEEDEDFINMLILHFNYLIDKGGDSIETYKSYREKLKSLRPQPKAELTLLDENIIAAAVAFVEQNDHFNCWRGIDKHTVIKALRSLKPHWKPSEEQMDALSSAGMHPSWGAKNCRILQSLYSDLQKLL